MKSLKILLFLLFFFTNLFTHSVLIPKLFDLKWGINYSEVEDTLLKINNIDGKLKYYNVFEGRNEIMELRSQASIKYYVDNINYNSIPSKIVFTFYNPEMKKSSLQLSKIEIFMKRKDNDNIWVDTKGLFKDILKDFITTYMVNIDSASEIKIYKIYEYQVVINSIYTHFIANVGNDILDKNTSIYISYEDNKLQNLILKKEKDILDNY